MKTLLGFALSGLATVWIGCSSDSSPVSPSASKALTDDAADAATPVRFEDAALKYEVALKVFSVAQMPPAANILSATITRAQMLDLETLTARGKGITDLTGLEYATNLDTLILGGNRIEDVSPLAGLTTNLKWLDLQRNRIRDVTPLKNLTKLEALSLYGMCCWGGTADSLVYLTKLKRFELGDGEFRGKVGPLVTRMPDLERLKVNGSNIDNLDFLVGLTKLEWLNISNNGKITDLKPLTCLPSLETLIVKRMDALIFRTSAAGAQVFTKHIHYLSENDVTVIYAYP